jgi:hypothetical protein
MNAQLKQVLDRVEAWPETAQQALAEAALDMEIQVTNQQAGATKPSLRQIMLDSPLADLPLDRVRT